MTAGTGRARRWARRLGAHPWHQHGLRLPLLALLAGVTGLGAAWAGLPQWTPLIGGLVCLIVDDVAGWYVNKWSSARTNRAPRVPADRRPGPAAG